MGLLVSQVTTSRDNEKVSLLQPEFGPAPNLTKVQVDSTAFLNCSVINLQEDNQVCNNMFSIYKKNFFTLLAHSVTVLFIKVGL